tara:strand:+ start:1453 stop:2058 length:606 start_codon:yes stop_codon:yes gene_type:complete
VTYIVGLTGGIGSGKSITSKFFTALGIDVIDTDEIARELTQPQGSAITAIKEIFGNAFITADGSLDRNKMRKLIFSNNILRQKLENILHPLIRKEAVRRTALAQSAYTIVVVPLLFETMDYHNMTQRNLVIDCAEESQITRTIARSKLGEQEVRAIMATQISRQDRLKKADDLIINNQDIEYLQKQVNDLHQKYLFLSKNK